MHAKIGTIPYTVDQMKKPFALLREMKQLEEWRPLLRLTLTGSTPVGVSHASVSSPINRRSKYGEVQTTTPQDL